MDIHGVIEAHHRLMEPEKWSNEKAEKMMADALRTLNDEYPNIHFLAAVWGEAHRSDLVNAYDASVERMDKALRLENMTVFKDAVKR